MSTVFGNSGESAHLVNDLTNLNNQAREMPNTDLHGTHLNWRFAKAWEDGELAIHVHAGVRMVGETITDDLCWLFERKRVGTRSHLQENSIGVPRNDLIDIVRNNRLIGVEGSVLVPVRESGNASKVTSINRSAIVWLRSLNDCPRISIGRYPIQDTSLRVFLSELDFLQELIPIVKNRELIDITRFLTISKDKLPDQMVERRTEVMDKVTDDQSEAQIRFRNRVARYDVPGVITPYVEQANIGVYFKPDIKFRFQSVQMLFGPPEFGSNASEVGSSNSHMLYHPYGEESGKETKDSKGARDTRAHKGRVRAQSQEGCKTRQVNASKPEEVESQTSLVPRSGGYTAKNTHLDMFNYDCSVFTEAVSSPASPPVSGICRGWLILYQLLLLVAPR